MDLVQEVFAPVLETVKENKKDLQGRQNKYLHGFKKWFIERIMDSLRYSELTPQVNSRGPDFTFSDGSQLETKAASDFRLNWIVKEGTVKYNVPVLFLCNGTNKDKIEQMKIRPEVRLLTYEYLSDGIDDWILGLVEPI